MNLNVEHISTYSLIIEEHTKLYISNCKNVDDELDYSMYKHICKKLLSYGYNHYEISNFAKSGYTSKHNLVYWNNLEYYGFGLGASGYIDNIRYENTRSINFYLKGRYVLNSHYVKLQEKLENEFILGFRKIDGINKMDFYMKYKKNLVDFDIIKKMLDDNKLIDNGKNIYINKDYLYVLNDILVDFIN